MIFTPHVDNIKTGAQNEAMKTYTTEDFKRWGKIGGKRRAKALTPKQRSDIARKAGSAKGKAKK